MILAIRQAFATAIKRGQFSKLTGDDVKHFQTIMKQSQILTDE
jgi:hypothetical protein